MEIRRRDPGNDRCPRRQMSGLLTHRRHTVGKCATLDWRGILLRMGSSLTPNQSFNSQESPSPRPETQRESDRLKLLLDITNTLISNLEPRDLIRAISTSIRQVMHCDVVGVWLPDAEQRQLRQLAMDFPESKGFAEEDSRYPVEGSLVGRVFRTGEPVVIGTRTDALNERETSEVRGEGIESGLCLPLI